VTSCSSWAHATRRSPRSRVRSSLRSRRAREHSTRPRAASDEPRVRPTRLSRHVTCGREARSGRRRARADDSRPLEPDPRGERVRRLAQAAARAHRRHQHSTARG
jgi:hypothetical protein